jgi:uncharacterized protein (DUF983 family)
LLVIKHLQESWLKMLLSCPHCSTIGKIPDIFRKFHGIPVSCHKCAHLFFVKQASDDAASFSVKDKYHISPCRNCATRLMIAGERRLSRGLTLLCPVCAHDTMSGSVLSFGKITFATLLLLAILLIVIVAVPSSLTIDPLVWALRRLPAEFLYYIDVLSLSLAQYIP